MKPEEVLRYCLEHLEGTLRAESWGESGIFYNPGGVLKRGVYVLTVKEKDGANDRASQLNRPGIYRVNLDRGGKPDLTGSLLDLWAEDRCSENRHREDGIMKCHFCPGVRPGGRGG